MPPACHAQRRRNACPRNVRLLGKLHGLLAPAPAPLARRPHGMLSMKGPKIMHVLLGHGPFWERNGPVDARAGHVAREVAQEVARLHGGHLSIRSQWNHGSCFTLELPLR